MNRAFHALKIAALLEERCYVVKGPFVRLHLQLSEPPPVGWSYLFTRAWQEAPHVLERDVGIEGDVIWITCIPAEFIDYHLPELEAAITMANGRYWESAQRNARVEQQRLEREQQARAEVAALAGNLYPRPAGECIEPPSPSNQKDCGVRHAWRLFWRTLGIIENGR
jgi:hypothetical protein